MVVEQDIQHNGGDAVNGWLSPMILDAVYLSSPTACR